MSYLDKVTVGSTTYDIQDSKAQADVNDLKSALARTIINDSNEVADLDIADPEGNVLARFVGGEFETKNFRSADTKWMKDAIDSDADLEIADTFGHALARFRGGGIETKEFRGLKYITFAADGKKKSNTPLTLTVERAFKRGDRIVIHMERGAMPWDAGADVTYKYDDQAFVTDKRLDCAWYEYTMPDDADSITAVYGANAVTAGTVVQLQVSVLGDVPIRPTVVSVKKDGSGDYTNLRDALDAIGINANDVLNPYRIEIYPGTYDVLEDYTDTEIRAANYTMTTGFVGPKLLNGVSLIGVGRPEEIILTAKLDREEYGDSVCGAISTLNLQGDNTIENLTIVAESMRYCIHDDFQNPFGKPLKRVMKNIILRAYGVMSYNPPNTYGAGIPASGMDYWFENVDFGHTGGLHTRNTLYYFPRIYLRHCKGYSFGMYDYNTSTNPNDQCVCIFDNCDFNMIGSSIDPNAEHSVSHIMILGTGGSSPMYACQPIHMYNTGDVRLTIKNNLEVGTAVERTNIANGFKYVKATSINKACGVVVYQTETDTYVQIKGYVKSDRLGLTGLSVGNYVGLDANARFTVVQDANSAIGKVTYTSGAVAYIKMQWRF